LKILIVSNSLSGGGAERSMNTLANELFSRKYDVTQIVLNNASEDTVKNLAPVIEIHREWKAGLLSTIYGFLKFNFFLLEQKPRVLILNCELAELYGAFSIYTGKIIAVEHTKKPWHGREKIGYMVRLLLHVRKIHWIKVSSLLSIWPLKKVNARTLENAIVPISARKSSKNIKIENLVFVGRFTTQKQVEILPELAKSTNKNLILFGEGELLNWLLKQCQEKQIHVKSHGYTNELWELIPENSLLLVPSKWEGDGMVVIEAAFANMPFLVSDIPEFRRFSFPNRNYCKKPEDYVATIHKYEDCLHKLEMPSNKVFEFSAARNPAFVAEQWEMYLKSIIQ